MRLAAQPLFRSTTASHFYIWIIKFYRNYGFSFSKQEIWNIFIGSRFRFVALRMSYVSRYYLSTHFHFVAAVFQISNSKWNSIRLLSVLRGQTEINRCKFVSVKWWPWWDIETSSTLTPTPTQICCQFQTSQNSLVIIFKFWIAKRYVRAVFRGNRSVMPAEIQKMRTADYSQTNK